MNFHAKPMFTQRLFEDFLHAADLTVGEANLDAVRVVWRICEQVFDHAGGLFTGALVLFEDDRDGHSGADVGSDTVRHIKTV